MNERVAFVLRIMDKKELKQFCLDNDITMSELCNNALANEIEMIRAQKRAISKQKKSKLSKSSPPPVLVADTNINDPELMKKANKGAQGARLTQIVTDVATLDTTGLDGIRVIEKEGPQVDEEPCKHRWTPDGKDKSKYYCEFCGEVKE